jgi:hypothetical protein
MRRRCTETWWSGQLSVSNPGRKPALLGPVCRRADAHSASRRLPTRRWRHHAVGGIRQTLACTVSAYDSMPLRAGTPLG